MFLCTDSTAITCKNTEHKEYDERCKRDIQQDLKSGIDLLFDFKNLLSKLHPGASESIIRMVREGYQLI